MVDLISIPLFVAIPAKHFAQFYNLMILFQPLFFSVCLFCDLVTDKLQEIIAIKLSKRLLSFQLA